MYPRFELPAGYDPRQRPWYKDAVAAGRTTLTEPYQDAATNELIITAATPAQARCGGWRPQPEGAGGYHQRPDFNGMGHAFLVSGDGKILVHPDGSKVMKSLGELFLDMRRRWMPTTAKSNWTGRRASSASAALRACLR